MLKRDSDSALSVECAIVDGAMPAGAAAAHCVLSRAAVGFEPRPGEPLLPHEASHTPMCAQAISSIDPDAKIHVVQVFERDGDDIPADRVLEGLRTAARIAPDVACLPWTIAETRLTDEFLTVCSGLAAKGTIVVAAWARDTERPIPASFDSVVGVEAFDADTRPCRVLRWSDGTNAAATPFGPSKGTAIVAGLAMAYSRATPRPTRSGFIESIKGFAPNAPEIAVPETHEERKMFDMAAFGAMLGTAYREYLAKQRT